MRVEISAPATTANLGPGFDRLGAALGMSLDLVAEIGEPVESIPMSISLADTDADHGPVAPDLITGAAVAVAGRLDGLRSLEVRTSIPLGRGLGSSASAIAAGLVLGAVLAEREPDPSELLALGLPLEGHPDNLAPALFGGLCLALGDGQVLRFDPDGRVEPLVLAPTERLPTAAARGALPDTVALEDAVANLGWAAGLLSLLTGAAEPTPARLLSCTDDRLHQPYRAALMRPTHTLIETLRAEGVAACVSGAGPSVLCLVTRASAGSVPVPDGWTLHRPGWDLRGARVIG